MMGDELTSIRLKTYQDKISDAIFQAIMTNPPQMREISIYGTRDVVNYAIGKVFDIEDGKELVKFIDEINERFSNWSIYSDLCEQTLNRIINMRGKW